MNRPVAWIRDCATAAIQRMRGKAVFYPMGWDDNELPHDPSLQARSGAPRMGRDVPDRGGGR